MSSKIEWGDSAPQPEWSIRPWSQPPLVTKVVGAEEGKMWLCRQGVVVARVTKVGGGLIKQNLAIPLGYALVSIYRDTRYLNHDDLINNKFDDVGERSACNMVNQRSTLHSVAYLHASRMMCRASLQKRPSKLYMFGLWCLRPYFSTFVI